MNIHHYVLVMLCVIASGCVNQLPSSTAKAMIDDRISMYEKNPLIGNGIRGIYEAADTLDLISKFESLQRSATVRKEDVDILLERYFTQDDIVRTGCQKMVVARVQGKARLYEICRLEEGKWSIR